MIEGYKLNGVTVYTPKQLREEMGVSKPLMKVYIQKMVEGVEFIKVDKDQLNAIKADTDGTPLGEIYKKMYTATKLVTEKGRARLLQHFGKAEVNTNVPVPQETPVASVEDIKMADDKVDGRSLHEFLQIDSNYTTWFERMTEYGFCKGVDFFPKMERTTTPYGRPEINHELTIDMAKELCMIQRTPRGKQARQYFIECEKKLKEASVPSYMIDDQIQRAERWIAEQRQRQALVVANKQYQQIIGELTPKADYTDKILQSRETMPITAIAKDYGMSAKEMNKTLYKLGVQYKIGGQWFLYAPYQNNGYTHSKTGEVEKEGVIVHTFMNTEWTQKGRLFLYNILKDKLDLLPMIEREIKS
jgi:anti-repressor protein